MYASIPVYNLGSGKYTVPKSLKILRDVFAELRRLQHNSRTNEIDTELVSMNMVFNEDLQKVSLLNPSIITLLIHLGSAILALSYNNFLIIGFNQSECAIVIPSVSQLWDFPAVKKAYSTSRYFRSGFYKNGFTNIYAKQGQKLWLTHDVFRDSQRCTPEMLYDPSTIAAIVLAKSDANAMVGNTEDGIF